MAAPKKRHSKSKVGRRRANQGLKKQQLVACPSCNAPKTSAHRACGFCGAYTPHNAKRKLSKAPQAAEE